VTAQLAAAQERLSSVSKYTDSGLLVRDTTYSYMLITVSEEPSASIIMVEVCVLRNWLSFASGLQEKCSLRPKEGGLKTNIVPKKGQLFSQFRFPPETKNVVCLLNCPFSYPCDERR
jgi:hypothetical protein